MTAGKWATDVLPFISNDNEWLYVLSELFPQTGSDDLSVDRVRFLSAVLHLLKFCIHVIHRHTARGVCGFRGAVCKTSSYLLGTVNNVDPSGTGVLFFIIN